MSRSSTTPARSPAALWTALALGLVGVAIALVLVRLHQQAHAGIASFCAISETFNCDRVATSRYSVVLGLPVAVWGALGYGLAAALAGWGLAGRGRSLWPRGLLFLVAAASVAACVALALVSKLLIGAWCIMCVASWGTALGLLASAWRACQPEGCWAAVRHDLGAVRANPVTTGAAIEVPHWTAYPPPIFVLVTPLSSPIWQPGATTSGFIRPSSVGPHDAKVVADLSLELTAPTAITFFDAASGSIVL